MHESLLNSLIIVALALFLPGVINRVRALLSGRKGVRLHQHINDVRVLMRKSTIYSPTTTFIYRLAPAVYLAAAIIAMLFIPVGSYNPVFHFNGDVILFAYLLALTRFVLILGAMDTGSSFQGMGASREALYGALIEPVLFVALGTLAMVSGQTSFAAIFSSISHISPEIVIVLILLSYTLTRVVAVEMGRVPVDDPRTHLELTMIHEVMVLDYCGVDLAFIKIGGWFKMAALSVLAANAAAAIFSLNIYAVIGLAIAIAVIIGFTESFRARNRLSRNATYIMTILALVIVIFMMAYISLQNIITS